MSLQDLKPGIRVVRGPDWKSARLDGGEGNLGTVIYVPNQESSSNTVLVVWDTGRELNHKAGQKKGGQTSHELRIYDNAPTGVRHTSIACDECNVQPLAGIRWKCAVCDDFDLCNPCYMNDKHDTTHSFIRVETPNSNKVYVGPRESSSKIDVKGIFRGAQVEAFSHWKGRRKDVIQGKPGKVVSVEDWGQCSRGAVKVEWSSKHDDEDTCRVGAEGKVDVVTSRPVKGGSYYPEHLPVLDIHKPYDEKYCIGDKVRIDIDLETFKKFQEGHGGWVAGMEQCQEEIGTVTEIHHDSTFDEENILPISLTLMYQDGCSWMVNRSVVQKLHSFAPNDLVEILRHERRAMILQKGHGGWIDDMNEALGKLGRVISVDTYGDLQVMVEENQWVFAPTCCTPAELLDNANELKTDDVPASVVSVQEPLSKRVSVENMGENFPKFFAQVIQAMYAKDDKAATLKDLIEAACSGDYKNIKTMLAKEPDLVNQKYEGKTALQAACYKCHTDCVKELLASLTAPDLSITDDSGDTALHYAALSKSSDIVGLLLTSKCRSINAVNQNGRTALHIAVSKEDTATVQQLLFADCDVNIQDDDGDTALHDAIEKDNEVIIDMLLKADDLDLTIENERGFNLLHWATLKNSIYAVQMMVRLNENLLGIATRDTHTVLHLSAVNNHFDLLHLFIEQKIVPIDSVDGEGFTALHLAATKRHKNCVEVLLKAGADINKQNHTGDTALHLSLADTIDPSESQKNCENVTQSPNKQLTPLICLLLEKGGDLEIKNVLGQTPLQLVSEDMKHVFESISKMAKGRISQRQKSPTKSASDDLLIPLTWEKMSTQDRYLAVELMPSTSDQSEYLQVKNHFTKTLPQVNIVKISRIQNKICWQQYMLQKQNMEKLLGTGCSNELNLFHGTLSDAVEGICINNFDFRNAGERVGAMYGKGVYFARDSKLADGYAYTNRSGHKFVFRAAVLAGKLVKGSKAFKKPPPIDSQNPHILYDCCVDNASDPKIYVLFQVNQFYPEYLIEYY